LYPAAYSEVFNETFGPVSHHAIGIAFRLQQCKLTKDQLQALGCRHKTAAELYRAVKEQAKGGQALTSTNLPDWSGVYTRQPVPGFAFDPDPSPDGVSPLGYFTPHATFP